eukprot:3822759-Karenia_brevis.AAC.1
MSNQKQEFNMTQFTKLPPAIFESAAPKGTHTINSRMTKLNMTQSEDLQKVIFTAIEALEKECHQRHGHTPVHYEFEIVKEWRHKNMTHALVRLILTSEKLQEECIKHIRLDSVKERGLAFPWAEYYRLQMRLKAARQTTQHGYPIVFLNFEHVQFDNRSTNTVAEFQYKHVHEHAAAWSEKIQPYVVKKRITDLLDNSAPIPDDPVEKYLPGKFTFTAGFFRSLPNNIRDEVRAKLAEKDLSEKRLREQEHFLSNMQDMESIAQQARVSPRTASFLHNLAKMPYESFTSHNVLKDVMENPSRMFQDIDGVTNVFWRHLSAYEVRGRQPEEDENLFKKCCEVRNGPRRCHAAEEIHYFFSRMKIKLQDIQDHAYNGRIFTIFVNFLCNGPINAHCVQALLQESEDFEGTVREEFGHWPFAYGLKRRHKEAMSAFATIFARCSEAPWTTTETDE